MSDQPPPGAPYPPAENQVPDPWAAAQQSEFVYDPQQQSSGAQGEQQQGGQQWGQTGDSRWGAVPGSRMDTDPYAEQKVGPLPRAEAPEVKTGKRLAIGCGVAAVLVGLVGIVAAVIYYRTTTKSGIEAIDTALATKARVSLEQAVRDEQLYLAQHDKYTDSPPELARQGSTNRYVNGTATTNMEEIAVLLCEDVSGVLLQTQVKKETYFAVFMSLNGSTPYWARGQQACPVSIDDEGNPGDPWSYSDAVLTGKTPTGPPKTVDPPTRKPTSDPDSDSGPLVPSSTGRGDTYESPFP